MKVRKVSNGDIDEWVRMRNSLWCSSRKEHLEEIYKYFSKGKTYEEIVFVLEQSNGKLGGFIELRVRNYAEGSQSEKVPYIEGWYIDLDLRGCGYGKKLIQIAENWAIENGFHELASDAEIENLVSIAAHKALGFEEVDRIVCLIKKLI